MNQSTIYDRNMRRLARSEENIRDGRLPFIRIMAAIPLLNCLVPKYTASSEGKDEKTKINTVTASNNRMVAEDSRKWSPIIVSEKKSNNNKMFIPTLMIGGSCAAMLATYHIANERNMMPFMIQYVESGSSINKNMIGRLSKGVPSRFGSAFCATCVAFGLLARNSRVRL